MDGESFSTGPREDCSIHTSMENVMEDKGADLKIEGRREA